MIFVDAFEFFVDAMQRVFGLNIRFDDSVGAQFDIYNDFSSFLDQFWQFYSASP